MLPVQPWPKKEELSPCSVEVVLVDNLASKSRSTTRRGRRRLVQAPFRRRSQPISSVAVSAVHSPCSSTGSNEKDKNYRDMQNGLPHYDLLHAIFGGSLATGEFAVPSTDPYLRQAHDGAEFDRSGDDKQDAMTMETGPRSGDKRASYSRARKGKQKKGSTRAEYECNMSALASVLMSRLDTDVSSAHSRQSGPRDVSMDQVVDIVGSLPDLTEQQIIGAFEFFRVNPDAVPIFLRMQPRFRSSYIRFVVS